MSDLSTATRDMLRAAKADGPSQAARGEIWNHVASQVGAGAAGGATGIAVTGKILATGTLFGSGITVGIAVALLRFTPAASSPSAQPAPVPAYVQRIGSNERVEPRAPHAAAALEADINEKTPNTLGAAAGYASDTVEVNAKNVQNAKKPAASPQSARPSPTVRGVGGRAGGVRAIETDDSLSQESRLLAEARTALRRNDAETALQRLRASKALRERQLVAESLALEAQAYRLLGLTNHARSLNRELVEHFPGNPLAREGE